MYVCCFRFGVAWILIIGFGICLGVYRKHRMRRMQIIDDYPEPGYGQRQHNMQWAAGNNIIYIDFYG